MVKLALVQVDAFTQMAYGGNPCAVVFDADELSSSAMLAIAREMNLSETAFVMRSEQADFRARYFTPAEEIPLAGHPTIATVFALIHTRRLLVSAPEFNIRLQLEAGVIDIAIDVTNPALPLITMSQLKPRFMRVYDPEVVLRAFGLMPADALPGAPIMTVSTGTPQLMIPLRDLDCLRRARPDVAAYAALRASGDFFSPHLFVLTGVSAAGTTFARHFGVPPDTPEDPVTGSATGGMAAYLWRHGLIDSPRFIAEQGDWMGRAGQVFVEVVGAPDDIKTVKVGGHAAVVMEGQLIVPNKNRSTEGHRE